LVPHDGLPEALLFLTVAAVVVWSMLNAREPARGD
jgi:hypothetical protein